MGRKTNYEKLKAQIIKETEELKKENKILTDQVSLEFAKRLAKCYKEPCGLNNLINDVYYCQDRKLGVRKHGDSYCFTIRNHFHKIDVHCSNVEIENGSILPTICFKIVFWATDRHLNGDALTLAAMLAKEMDEATPLLADLMNWIGGGGKLHKYVSYWVAVNVTDKTKEQLLKEYAEKMVTEKTKAQLFKEYTVKKSEIK